MINIKIEKVIRYKSYASLLIENNNYLIDYYFYECLLPYDGKVIDEHIFKEIVAFSEARVAISRLYKKIFNHEISTYELKTKLTLKKISGDYVEIIVKRLKEENQLKEDDLIARYIDYYQEYKGKKAFERFLKSKKISERKIQFAMDNFLENEENAYEYAKKYIKNKVCSKALLRQKVKLALENRGYTFDTIKKVVDSLEFEDDDNSLIKEIEIYKKKYSNDYYKVISKLITKGYQRDLINKYLKKEGSNYED